MRVSFGRFTFDSGTRELLEGARRVHVSPKAFDLLQILLERRPAVVTKPELQERVWAGTFVGEANLTVVVAEIREALGDDSRNPTLVRTVHRVGYSFCAAAADMAPATEPSSSARFSGCWLVWGTKTFPLAAGENTIGRDPRCPVWIDASGVSKRHARITVGQGGAYLEDLGSSNGTFVGERRIAAPHTLADGDVIHLGAVTVSFRMWSDEQPPKTERIAPHSRCGAEEASPQKKQRAQRRNLEPHLPLFALHPSLW